MENKIEVFKYKSCKAMTTLYSNSFAAQDVKSITKHPVLEIIVIRSKESCKGHATKLLSDIVNRNTDKLIILSARPMFDTEEYEACLDLKERIAKLIKFYENRGFTSINDLVGYEHAVAMCYKNEVYDEFKKSLDKFRKSNALGKLLDAGKVSDI